MRPARSSGARRSPARRAPIRRSVPRLVAAATAAALVGIGLAVPASAGTAPAADLGAAVHYLATTTAANAVVNGTSLAHDGYYESFAGFADFGLTLDGAFALAATATDNATLTKVVDFLDQAGKDGSGQSVNDWTGIGTAFASGGSIGKEALLAEATGFDPHAFGGHDLVAALDGLVCTSTDVTHGCAGPGNYVYATSTVSQALGVLAQVRAGDATNAGAAIAYLEHLQNAQGAWPSLLPSSGDADVDSTAMAAMALALLPGDATASAAVTKAESWIASRQRAGGDFAGTSGSTNSAALAILALRLAGTTYSAPIAAGSAFLVSQQNGDGGFNVGAGGPRGSDVRATTQVVNGLVGTPFGTITDDIASWSDPTTTTAPTTTTSSPTGAVSTTTLAASALAPTSTSVATTTTGAGASATAGAGSATLPATGADTTGAGELVVVLLGLGAVAAGVRRRR